MIQQIDHVNIVVIDLEKMVSFYCGVLGLAVSKRVTISGEWIDQTVGLAGVLADVVYLDPPFGPRIELIRYRTPGGTRPQGLGESNTPGLRHMAFKVDEIDRFAKSLATAGVKFFSKIQQVPETQVTYTGGVKKRLVYFHDPEGTLLELCSYE